MVRCLIMNDEDLDWNANAGWHYQLLLQMWIQLFPFDEQASWGVLSIVSWHDYAVPCVPSTISHNSFHNHKGIISQNCLCGCSFDLKFIYALMLCTMQVTLAYRNIASCSSKDTCFKSLWPNEQSSVMIAWKTSRLTPSSQQIRSGWPVRSSFTHPSEHWGMIRLFVINSL